MTSFLDTGRTNGQIYYYKVTALNAIGESVASNEANATPSAPASAPSAPQSLQATAGNAQVSLAWTAPSSNGGSAITGYRVYRGTAPNPTVALTPDLGVVTSFLDTGRTNGQIYYYKVTALNAIGESVASNEANATPSDLVLPVEPLSILDTFDRANENPLSFASRWGNGILGSSERSLKVVSNQCASDRTTTATAWWKTQLGPDSEAYATITTLPGNGNAVRLYVRLQTPGSAAVDGYMLLFTQSSGTDQLTLYRVTNGALTQLAVVNQEIAAGNRASPSREGDGARSVGTRRHDMDPREPSHGFDVHGRRLHRDRDSRKDRTPRRLRRALGRRSRGGRRHVRKRREHGPNRVGVAVDRRRHRSRGRPSADRSRASPRRWPRRARRWHPRRPSRRPLRRSRLRCGTRSSRRARRPGGRSAVRRGSQPGSRSPVVAGGRSERAPQCARTCRTSRKPLPYSVSS